MQMGMSIEKVRNKQILNSNETHLSSKGKVVAESWCRIQYVCLAANDWVPSITGWVDAWLIKGSQVSRDPDMTRSFSIDIFLPRYAKRFYAVLARGFVLSAKSIDNKAHISQDLHQKTYKVLDSMWKNLCGV